MMNANRFSRHERDLPDCCTTPDASEKDDSLESTRIEKNDANDHVVFITNGMSCMACVNKIKNTLIKHPGVARARVDLSQQTTSITFSPEMIGPQELKAMIEALGYTVTETEIPIGIAGKYEGRAESESVGPFPYILGTATALSVIGFYLGLLTLTSDWYNAAIQFSEYRWWIVALALGLGLQVTLFTFLKKRLQKKGLKSAKSGLAASGGMSTASMAACCAHYLVPLLPALGLPFLSAAVAAIADYQSEIFLLGVLSNLFGLGVMLRVMNKNGIFRIGTIADKVKFGFQRS